ncbi:MAG: TlpA disulfide reductase family protein [Pseudomonadota bacterium]
MSKKILTIIITLFLTLITQVAFAKADSYDIYGKPHNFSLSKKGQWVIINYWADWCHACVEEIPQLNKLAELLKDKPVVFYGVNYDSMPDRNQQEFAQQFQVNYLLMRDNPFNESTPPRSQIVSLPVTFVISPTGQVRELNGELQINEILRIIG